MLSATRTLSCIALAFAMFAPSADVTAQSAQSAQTPDPRLTAPADPQPGPTRPDPDGGDAKVMQLVVLRDLALQPGFSLGGIPIAWGNTAVIPAAAASSKQKGKCSFRYVYATRNIGPAASLATHNRIMFQTKDGAVLSSRSLAALASNAAANSSGHVWLAPGTWMLYVHADATGTNAETDEANNLRRVRVTVTGSCV
jgi:hypothetical protein